MLILSSFLSVELLFFIFIFSSTFSLNKLNYSITNLLKFTNTNGK